MSKVPQLHRLMFVFAGAALVAAAANFACLEDVCADLKTAEFRTMEDIEAMRVLTLAEALREAGLDQPAGLKAGGGTDLAKQLDRPLKLPNGEIEIPLGYLPDIPADHPWAQELNPSDDAFYSYFEERILRPRLYDPENPKHQDWARAYLDKSRSNSPEFIGWTYANRTECGKSKFDAMGTCQGVTGTFDQCPRLDAF